MNARTLLNNEIAELMEIDANDKTIQALRSLDTLTIKAIALIIATGLQNHWPSAKEIVDEAAALGYGPEDR